ncbi:hypothetical protein ACFX2J_013490 [Malus domestica]
MPKVKTNQALTTKRKADVVILNRTPQEPIRRNYWEKIGDEVSGTTNNSVETDTQVEDGGANTQVEALTRFDKAVEYGGTRWEQIRSKVKSRKSNPKWKRKKMKRVDAW